MATDDVKRVVCSYHPERVFCDYHPDVIIADNAWCDTTINYVPSDVYVSNLKQDFEARIEIDSKSIADVVDSIIPLQTIDPDRISRKIKRVIFNDPATIVLWKDGSKTVVKCGMNDTFDKEKGLMACIIKYLTGGKGRWNEIIKKWVTYDEPAVETVEVSHDYTELHNKPTIGEDGLNDESTVSNDDETVSWSDETTIEEDETPVFEDVEDFVDDDVDDEPIDEDEEDDADEDS